jgi:hypothetical protein
VDSNNDESQYDGAAVENEECREEVLLEPNLRSQGVYTVCLVLRLHSTQMQSLPVRERICSEWAKSQTQLAPDLQWTLLFWLQNSVIQTFTGGHRGKKVKHHASMMALLQLVFSCCILQDYHTACGGDEQILSLVHGQSGCWTFSPN